jgi:hypothetical protein
MDFEKFLACLFFINSHAEGSTLNAAQAKRALDQGRGKSGLECEGQGLKLRGYEKINFYSDTPILCIFNVRPSGIVI